MSSRVSRWIVTACALMSVALPPGASAQSPDVDTRIAEMVEAAYPEIERLYLQLHRNPELSFHEEATAKTIGAELAKVGFTVTHGVGGHGVVGVLANGDGPTVMVRTDLDALPLTEDTGLAYASRVRTKDEEGREVGVMHACGHDVHMSCFVATARNLAASTDLWKGTLVFVGQPAEERGAGARAMLEDGLFERFPRPDHALALHVSASLPAGTVGWCPGYALANVDMVDIVVRGEGGHGAYPHRTKDPIVMAAEMVLAMQTIVSREISPTEPAVVTVGSFHGGTKHNIIPAEVKLELTCRSYSDTVRQTILDAIRRITANVARAHRVAEDRLPVVTVRNESIPSTYNSPELAQSMAAVFRRVMGADAVVQAEAVMGGEDFGCYGRVKPEVPIFIYWLGAVAPEVFARAQADGTTLPSLHSPFFAPHPEPTLKTGIRTMTAAVLELMGTR